ncbi:MAG: pyroglutamyl-peptidase I [Oscillospiraceae bacterium]|nr:pyroglutamyl-peptidase I [Oscillospiraceae bacterium]
MKILITGFDPFDKEKINPAYEAVKLLPDKIGNAEIIKLEIPTVFGKGACSMEKAIEQHNPDCVICIGQAGGRSCISIEKVAINFIDARIADNDGNQPINTAIIPDGPTAYFSTLPIRAMAENIREHGIPAHISYTAGTFVCNEVMYRLLHFIDTKYHHIRGGFIHVPYTAAQAASKPDGTASMDEKIIAKGLEYAILAIAQNKEHSGGHMGTTH